MEEKQKVKRERVRKKEEDKGKREEKVRKTGNGEEMRGKGRGSVRRGRADEYPADSFEGWVFVAEMKFLAPSLLTGDR